jgi:1-acyl-sn-glycerol-3-phosphate acyltransferase
LTSRRTPSPPPPSQPFDPDRFDGRSPELIARLLPVARMVCDRYFQLKVEGIEHVGREPALLAANHNSGLAGPDIACTLIALWCRLGPHAPVYALAHDFAMRHFPPFGRFIQRFGGVRATPENARRGLAAGGQVLVYPGGDLEAYRHSRRRNEIVLGPRTGFIRVAQQAGVPIVPVVSHGAHSSAYIFVEGEKIARALRLKQWARLERFPLAFALPWGFAPGPWLPYLPLPFPIRIRFLQPVRVAPDEDPAAARERVRALMQGALDSMARAAWDAP